MGIVRFKSSKEAIITIVQGFTTFTKHADLLEVFTPDDGDIECNAIS
jgi:hypothetical protein